MILIFFSGFFISILLLLIGLIKPSLVLRWGNSRTRKRSTLLYGIITIICLVGMVVVTPDTTTQEQVTNVPNNQLENNKIATSSEALKESNSEELTASESNNAINEAEKEANDVNIVRIQLEKDVYSSPTFYEGEINEAGQPHGEGNITYTMSVNDSSTNELKESTLILYIGGFQNGEYHGQGTLYREGYADIEYSGIFENGEKIFFPYQNEFYFDNGEISFHGEQSKTKSGETMKVYYPGGNIYYSGEWEDNQINGEGIIFHDVYPEQKEAEGSFENGELNGDGKTFYQSGTLKEEGTFAEGKLEGNGKTYYTNGNLHLEGKFTAGDLDGKGMTFYENGNPESQGTYKDGKQMGKIKMYHENGSIAFEGSFEEGLMKPYGIYGNAVLYHENGEIMYKGEFKASKYHGEGTLYNDSGEVIQNGKWDEGNFIGD